MTEAILPRKPSELIRLAVADARSLDRVVYTPYSAVYHQPRPWTGAGNQCFVCFAGAVMAGTLGRPPDRYSTPGGFPVRDCDALIAIDWFRKGMWQSGLRLLGLHNEIGRPEVENMILGLGKPVAPHFTDWEAFDAFLGYMNTAADGWASIGL